MDLRLFAEPQQGATYDHQLAVARLGESLGFDAFFRSDHYQRIGAGDPGPGPTDSWVTLAGLARETSTIRLGTMVTSATFRHPGPLAVAVAEVDAMSEGRVELGIGAGWYEDEHRAYGIPFPDVVERFDRLEEQLAVITGLWTTPPGERFSFDGRHYPVVDSPALPKPRQQPRPPIIIGGRGTRRTPALAARYADEFNVIFPGRVHRFVAGRDVVARACEALGRDPGVDAMVGSAGALLWHRRRRLRAAGGRRRSGSRPAAGPGGRRHRGRGGRAPGRLPRRRCRPDLPPAPRPHRSRPHPPGGGGGHAPRPLTQAFWE